MKTIPRNNTVTRHKSKHKAVRRRQTKSERADAAKRMIVKPVKKNVSLPPLPAFNSGGMRVNVADRDALYSAMDNRATS